MVRVVERYKAVVKNRSSIAEDRSRFRWIHEPLRRCCVSRDDFGCPCRGKRNDRMARWKKHMRDLMSPLIYHSQSLIENLQSAVNSKDFAASVGYVGPY